MTTALDHRIESSTRGKTNNTLVWTTVLVALQNNRTNKTVILTSVLIVLLGLSKKVGLKTHRSGLVYQ